LGNTKLNNYTFLKVSSSEIINEIPNSRKYKFDQDSFRFSEIKYDISDLQEQQISLYKTKKGDIIKTIPELVLDFVKTYNIDNNKHIPHHYKCNTRDIQLELLAGIIDACGEYVNGCYKIVEKSKILVDDIVFLCRSLGFVVKIQKIDSLHVIQIYGKLIEIPVCKQHDDVLKELNTILDLHYKIELERLKKDYYYGFEIDKNRRFVLGDFTVTHNTVLAIYLSHLLKVKTLVIVHQEFLMDQWIERFQQFTDAKVGTIRQKKVDIENKDVVIGMVHSISCIDYDPEIFKQFGLVIYDEVHHLGSRMFSKALLKTSSEYTIGLSATPERSDGLMKIVNWHVGNILYKMEKKYNYKVLVKKVIFRSNDVLFKEKRRRWINGSIRPDPIKMVGNLIHIKERNNLIVNILNTLKSMGRKIFVLSSRVEHLETLKNAIDKIIGEAGESHIYNTYYYMGRSKKGERKLAEKNGDIIFATQQLAEEGLDISRLDTIIIGLPIKKEKTLVQSIGRILRNDTLEVLTMVPVVIDMSDLLSIYTKWSDKRDTVYCEKNWYIQNFYWEDNKYLYKTSENKEKKPMNIMFDDIMDEEFIEKNLIIKTPLDICTRKI
jgi:superfamily II DNA or RNA helicase